jgi:hydroxymethylglutaryl-CoA lyase
VACPFEGPIAPATVAGIAQLLVELGCDEIDLGDTIGVAVPRDVDRLIEAHLRILPIERITMHLHDTRGTALACAWRAIELGVRSFDGSCGGLGGCPFAPGAAGNLASEELIYACERSGLATRVDLAALLEAGKGIAAVLGRALPSRLLNAGLPPSGAASPITVCGESAKR